jgi:hypothetical protein
MCGLTHNNNNNNHHQQQQQQHQHHQWVTNLFQKLTFPHIMRKCPELHGNWRFVRAKTAAFWGVTPYISVYRCKCFGEILIFRVGQAFTLKTGALSPGETLAQIRQTTLSNAPGDNYPRSQLQNQVSYRVYNNKPLGHRWILSTPSYYTSLKLNLILRSHLGLRQLNCFFRSHFFTKISYAFLIFPMSSHSSYSHWNSN